MLRSDKARWLMRTSAHGGRTAGVGRGKDGGEFTGGVYDQGARIANSNHQKGSKNMKILILVLICGTFVGCASALNKKSALIHARSAQAEIANGNWDSARRHWAKAVVNGELGEMTPQAQAVFNYEYGRSLGVTCNYSESEIYLRKAYDLDKAINGPIYMSILELARLNYDQSKFKKAKEYYAQVIPLLDSVSTEKESPMEYSNVLLEYSDVLFRQGVIHKAESLKKHAEQIRVENPEGYSITDRTPYGRHCVEPNP